MFTENLREKMNLFHKRERITLYFILALGGMGLFFFLSFYNQVSPAASLQFQVSRSEAASIAERFLTQAGYDLKDYKKGILFQSDEGEAVFLEKSLGTEQANLFFDEEYAPWYWRLRWFQFLKQEEFDVAISPKGELVGFYHRISEKDGAGFLTDQEAYQTCKDYVEKALKVDLSKWAQVSHEKKDREHRRDHLFQWTPLNPSLKEGKMFLSCGVQGTEVSSFSKYVKVPPSFTDQQEQSAANRELLTLIFNLFYLLLGVFVGAEFLTSFKRSFFRWRIPLYLALGMFVLTFVSEMNSLSVNWIGIDTKESLSHFLLTEFLSSLMTSLWGGLFLLMVALAAENMQTLLRSEKPLLRDIFSSNYFLSKKFSQAIMIGYGLGALQLGYVAAYYLISQNFFGGWSPMDSPYFNIASSYLPWIFPLTIGLTAALNEELFFRMFAISFLKRWFKSNWIAVLIPAVIWGFLHSNYFVEPIYSRGLELAVVGVVLGFVYLQYGVLPAILAHYTYNSVLGFVPLLRSESFFFQISGWISLFWILLPGLLALISYVLIRKRHLTGEFVRKKVEEEPRKMKGLLYWGNQIAYEFLSHSTKGRSEKRKWMPVVESRLKKGFFCLLLFFFLLSIGGLYFFQPETLGGKPKILIGKNEAIETAKEYLEENGINAEYQNEEVAFFRNNSVDFNTVLVRKVGLEKANNILKDEKISFLRWGVLFYELKRKQRISISMNEQGRVVRFQYLQDENKKFSQELSAAEAKESALALLKQHRHWDWPSFKFVGEKTKQVKEGVEHLFIWEHALLGAPSLKNRIKILIQGDQLGGYQEETVVPESFQRGQKEKKSLETFFKALFAILISIAVLILVWDVVVKFRDGLFQWGGAAQIGMIFLFCELISKINGIPQIMVELAEAAPLNPSVYLLEKGLTLLVGQMVSLGFVIFLAAYGLGLVRQVFGFIPFVFKKGGSKELKQVMLQGALLGMLAFPLLWLGQQMLTSLQIASFPDSAQVSYLFFKNSILNTTFPGIELGVTALKSALVMTLSLGVMLAFLLKVFKKPVWVFLILAFMSSFQFFTSNSSWADIAVQVAVQTVILAGVFLGMRKCFKYNLFFYFTFFWGRALYPSVPLIGSSDLQLILHGWTALCLMGLPLLIFAFLPKLKLASKTG